MDLGREHTGAPVYVLGAVDFEPGDEGLEMEYQRLAGKPWLRHSTPSEKSTCLKDLADHRHIAELGLWVFRVGGVPCYRIQPRADHVPQLVDLLEYPGAEKQEASGVAWALLVGSLTDEPHRGRGMGMPETLPTIRVAGISRVMDDPWVARMARGGKADGEADHGAAIVRGIAQNVLRIVTTPAAVGSNDDDARALAYCAASNADLYRHMLSRHPRHPVRAIESRPAIERGARRIVDVVVTFANVDNVSTHESICHIDVTDLFPFQVGPIAASPV